MPSLQDQLFRHWNGRLRLCLVDGVKYVQADNNKAKGKAACSCALRLSILGTMSYARVRLWLSAGHSPGTDGKAFDEGFT